MKNFRYIKVYVQFLCSFSFQGYSALQALYPRVNRWMLSILFQERNVRGMTIRLATKDVCCTSSEHWSLTTHSIGAAQLHCSTSPVFIFWITFIIIWYFFLFSYFVTLIIISLLLLKYKLQVVYFIHSFTSRIEDHAWLSRSSVNNYQVDGNDYSSKKGMILINMGEEISNII